MIKRFMFKSASGVSFATVAFFSLMHFSVNSYAQYLTGPVASALGGAGRAAVDNGEQIFLNPAAIVHSSVFSSSLYYENGTLTEDKRLSRYGFSLADNSDDILFSGGYAFTQTKMSFPNGSTVHEDYHQIAMGKFVAKYLALGAAVTYMKSEFERGGDYSQWDGHIGLIYNPDPDYGVGLVFYNLAGQKNDIPIEIRNLDKVALGANYIFMPMFRMRVDLSQQTELNSNHRMDYQLGVESKFAVFWMSRFGFERDDLLGREYYSLGLAFDGPKLKIDYFYRKNADGIEGAMHGVDMRMGFW